MPTPLSTVEPQAQWHSYEVDSFERFINRFSAVLKGDQACP